jgi:hypothetical protein
MKDSITKSKQVQNAASLFLVLIVALVVTACGSSSNGNGSSDDSQDPKNDSKNPTFQTNYEISGMGVITSPSEHVGTSLLLNNVSMTGGDFYFNDTPARLEFRGSAITSISLTGKTVTIIADAELQQLNGTYTGGYLIELTIVDDDVDMFGIKITYPDTSTHTVGPYAIDMVNGNFTVTPL